MVHQRRVYFVEQLVDDVVAPLFQNSLSRFSPLILNLVHLSFSDDFFINLLLNFSSLVLEIYREFGAENVVGKVVIYVQFISLIQLYRPPFVSLLRGLFVDKALEGFLLQRLPLRH